MSQAMPQAESDMEISNPPPQQPVDNLAWWKRFPADATAGLAADHILWSELMPGGNHWSWRIQRGRALRFVALDADVNLSMVLYAAHDKLERYNMPDSLKAQHTAHYSTGHVLISDMGRAMASITHDTHEIKNPLTPMKLSIQYLDRAAHDNPEKAKELIPRISSTLIEQIDNLSQIANEFSNFASMPQASNEKVILNEIVETIHDLFRKRDAMDINLIEPINDLYVFADKNHLVRILNNLLKNAIQAIPDNKRGRIEIELKRQENEALNRISDNATGIPDINEG